MKCEKCGHEQESLAVLADRKGYCEVAFFSPVRGIPCDKEWWVQLETEEIIDPDGSKADRYFNGKTPQLAESEARQCLETLPDRGETKGESGLQ